MAESVFCPLQCGNIARFLRLGLLIASCCAFAVQAKGEPVTWDEITALTAPPADARISYGSAPQQFGELRLPTGPGPFPVAVIIHGGCWLAEYTLAYTAAFAAAFARAGIATWTLEYRRVGDPGGGWTGTFEDIARGIDAMPKLAFKYPLDLTRLVLIGHSAGGQLALWAAAQPTDKATAPRRPTVKIRGVVGLAVITDLEAYGKEGGPCGAAVAQVIGGGSAQFSARYASASPSALIPFIHHVRLLHGALDPIVPMEQSRTFATRSAAAKDDTTFTIIDGAGHFDFFAPSSPAFAAALAATRELLKPR